MDGCINEWINECLVGWMQGWMDVKLHGMDVWMDGWIDARMHALGKLVTEIPVDFVGFDNVVEFNKNRQNDDNVVKAYKS